MHVGFHGHLDARIICVHILSVCVYVWGRVDFQHMDILDYKLSH